VSEPLDELPDDAGTTWRAVVAELKVQKRDMLGSALAHGRVLSMAGDRVRLGYAETDGMYRKQVERSQRDAEAALSKVLGRPMGIVLETVRLQEAPAQSIAEEDNERTRARDERIRRSGREHPSVLAAMKLFGGVVEHIKVLEEEQDQEQFAAAPADEGEDAGPDEA